MNWRLTFLLLSALFITSCQTNEAPLALEETSVESPVSGDFTISFLCGDDLSCDSIPQPVFSPVTKAAAKPPKPKYANVGSYLQRFRKPPQKFVFDASKDFKIRGAEGTIVNFEGGSLVLADGTPVAGKVEVALEEFYHTADIVKARLTTVSDEGLLETDGMINLQVYSNGKACKLDEGKTVEVNFSGLTRKRMKLFSGRLNKQGDMEWTEQKVSTTAETKILPLLSNKELVFLNNFVRDIGKRVKYPKAAVDKKVQGTVYVTFFIDEGGTIRRERILRTDDNLLAKSVLYTFNNYPAFQLEEYDGVPINKEITMPIRFRLNDTTDLEAIMASQEEEEAIASTKLIMDENGKAAMPGYGWMVSSDYEVGRVLESRTKKSINNSFSSVSLGWINCDRFVPEVSKTDIYVNAGEAKDRSAYLIFKDINSVMPAYDMDGKSYFMGVPIGRDVSLVVLRLSENGEMEFAFQDFTVMQDMTISGLGFQTLTEQEFTQRLKGMSGSVAMVY